MANQLITESISAASKKDYNQALALCDEIFNSDLDQLELSTFLNGHYSTLISDSIDHCFDLVNKRHYHSAYQLIQKLLPRLEANESKSVAETLEGLSSHCLNLLLFSRKSDRPFDVLICGADEDLKEIHILKQELTKLGILVNDEDFIVNENTEDNSLKEQIKDCDALVVILSPNFFAANWPRLVFDEISKNYNPEELWILPVWHNITRNEVLAGSPALEKLLAFDTSIWSLSKIAQGIIDDVRPDLASAVIHKSTWSSIIQGKTLDQGTPEFELPFRHDFLDQDMIARIRLIRAAFIDGNRQTLKSWINSFRRELDPFATLLEWEKLARVFNEIKILQKHIQTLMDQKTTSNLKTFCSQFLNSKDDTILNPMIATFQDLSSYDSERVFMLTWTSSIPEIQALDFGFPPDIKWLASYILDSKKPLIEPVDDFVKNASEPSNSKNFIYTWDASHVKEEKINWLEGALFNEEERQSSKQWDVFISHASEDKSKLVRPLAESLQDFGVKVWYDNFTLRPGLDLSSSIYSGIENAEFGIIVLSPFFISKKWPRKEYEALGENLAQQGNRLITLWHGLPMNEGPDWLKNLNSTDQLTTSEQSLKSMTLFILKKLRPEIAEFMENRERFEQDQKLADQGLKKTKRVNLSELKINNRNFDQLPFSLVERIRLFRAVLFEGYPHSMEFWKEGFLRDTDPEKNIVYWEWIASLFQEAILGGSWVANSKKGGFLNFFRKKKEIDPESIFYLLIQLSNLGKSKLPELYAQFPEEMVNMVLSLLQAPKDFDMLEPG